MRSRLEHEHTPAAIQERLELGPSLSYLRDWVYGGIDGAVTTFAVVSGVVGADLSTVIILILGFANLVADGFSMAAGNYSATRSERQEAEHLRAIERRHIRIDPEGEREEIRQIFARKGFEGEDLERVVSVVASNEEQWIEIMLQEEYGVASEIRRPLIAATMTFVAFVLCGVVPLLPYLLELPHPFLIASIMTGATFFGIGSAKSRWSVLPWWRLGSETLAIGAFAASLAWLIGWLLRGLAG